MIRLKKAVLFAGGLICSAVFAVNFFGMMLSWDDANKEVVQAEYIYHTCDLGYDGSLSAIDCELYRKIIDELPPVGNLNAGLTDHLVCSIKSVANLDLPSVNVLLDKALEVLLGEISEVAFDRSVDCDAEEVGDYVETLIGQSESLKRAYGQSLR